LILIKQLLNYPEASGIITLKAEEEGDAVAVGAVVCLIDCSCQHLVRPSCSRNSTESSRSSKAESYRQLQSSGSAATYASGTPSPRKILDEKNIAPAALTGTGKEAELLKKML
jgi:2-oxoglutarate dehydrogenase E2 component (dihydrolipoamide succinyltransferase)